MMRRIESFIRTVIWNRLRKPAWQRLCKRTETLFAIGIRRLKSLSINITLVRNRTLTARAIGVYAVRKLIAQNRIGPIFKPLIRYLGFMFSGMKFSCKGRFTRRQRASLTVFSRGSVKLSTFTSDIDYSYAHVPLKFGVGCIKIWINRGFRNKHRTANSLVYVPYYKPRRSKIIGLSDAQKLRFTFELTPKLKATANQLKADALLADKKRYARITKQRINTIAVTKSFVKPQDLRKHLLYTYVRRRGTNSCATATSTIQDVIHDVKESGTAIKDRLMATYVRIQSSTVKDKHTQLNKLDKVHNLIGAYGASEDLKQYLFASYEATALRLFRLNYLERAMQDLRHSIHNKH